MAPSLILPHGGKLINKYIEKNYDDLKTFEVSSDIRNDAENIATGVFSPLEGFMIQEDFLNVLKEGRLSNSIPWTLPIVLDTEKEIANQMKELRVVVLCSGGESCQQNHFLKIYPAMLFLQAKNRMFFYLKRDYEYQFLYAQYYNRRIQLFLFLFSWCYPGNP